VRQEPRAGTGINKTKTMKEEQRQRLRDLAGLLTESAETGRPIQVKRTVGEMDWTLAESLRPDAPFEYRIAPMDPFDEWWLSYKPHRVCPDDTARQDCSNAWHAALQHAKNPSQ